MRNAVLLFLLFLLPLLFSDQVLFLQAVDLDNDGISDGLEDTLAGEFLPLIYFTWEEACPGPGVLLYHVRPFAPGVDTVLSISYVLLFYDDCGGTAHKGDAESLCLTLFEDPACPRGYRVHSIRTYAHQGIPVCEYVSTVTVDRCDFGASAGDAVYASQDKHALFIGLADCNSPERWFCDDACEAGLLMNNGSLIFPEAGQSWYMYNVGEPDYPLIEDLSELNNNHIGFYPLDVWDYCHFCGDEAFSPGDNCPATVVSGLFRSSSGPWLPVNVSFDAGGAVPSPMGYCRDQFLYLHLPFGGNVIAHLYSISGDVTDKVYLPYFCQEDELKTPYWDGVNMNGYCAPPGNYYLVAEAQRGDSHAQTDPIRFGITGDEGRPNAPADLEGAGNSYAVALNWTDRSGIEEAYIVERSFDMCPYRVVAVLPANTVSWLDTPFYEGLARYRVAAHRTLGGNSGYSNEVLMQLSWDLSAPVLSGTEGKNPHRHFLDWQFDPGGVPFGYYSLYKRYRIPLDGCDEGGVPGDWSQWFDIYDCFDLFITSYVDSALIEDNCYEYMVSAVTTGPPCTLFSNVVNFHGNCDGAGCPVLFSDRGQSEQRITNLLPRCEFAGNAETAWRSGGRAATGSASGVTETDNIGDIVDVVHIGAAPIDTKGMIELKIEEVSEDTTCIDEIRLLSVALPGGVSAGIPAGDTTTNRIIAFDRMVQPSSATHAGGADILSMVSARDGMVYRGSAGDELIVEFDRGTCPDSIFGISVKIEDPQVKAAGPIIRVQDEATDRGRWSEVCTVYPHQNESIYLVGLSGHLRKCRSTVRLKLEQIGNLSLDFLFLTRELASAAEVREVELLRAVSEEGEDVSHLIAKSDGARAVLEKAESISLYYRVPPGTGEGTEYFLEVRGHYVRGTRCGTAVFPSGPVQDIDTSEAR